MKEIKIISEGQNYSAIELGRLDMLTDYSYMHPKLKQLVKGKVFIGEKLKTTGVEISFQILPPETEIPFLHCHNKHEEVYIILKGAGQFQVDDDIFDVSEGSVIRISPAGKRTWRNNSENPMILIVIQSQDGTLDNHFIADGFRVAGEIKRKV